MTFIKKVCLSKIVGNMMSSFRDSFYFLWIFGLSVEKKFIFGIHMKVQDFNGKRKHAILGIICQLKNFDEIETFGINVAFLTKLKDLGFGLN